MIGSNIPLAPATPIKALPPKQCFKPSIIQNRHRVQHSIPSCHRWDIHDGVGDGNNPHTHFLSFQVGGSQTLASAPYPHHSKHNRLCYQLFYAISATKRTFAVAGIARRFAFASVFRRWRKVQKRHMLRA